MLKRFLIALLAILICYPAFSKNHKKPVIIPEPFSLILKKGYFKFSESTKINIGDEKYRSDAGIFNQYLKKYYGFELEIIKNDNILPACINIFPTIPVKDEAYGLDITKSEITIYGDQNGGVFHAFQTLKQLIPAGKKKHLKIKCMAMYDYPAFPWRGMHLDVCRHFFPKEFIKEYIDFLAFYKMNTFHWHLTDDQGWRIEIKKYPELTKTGAYRKGTKPGHSSGNETNYDTSLYGGYYSQDDIREIVEYARQRHISIVPEIEMPGHSLAAITAYPVFSCTGGPFNVATKWGVFDDVFCPKDTTFMFLEDVLTEVLELFPGKYIHIGGDEVPKTRWHSCPNCQALIKSKGLKDESELQSYFIRHIDSFITAHGRNIIGWDEILDGGLAPNAAVMSWRGIEGGIAAAKQHHSVVMTPGGYCYFDHYQGDPRNEPLAIGGYTTLEKVYSFNPVPAGLDSIEKKFILGAQGNLWTEYIADTKQVEYMVFPRICALSEVLWSPAAIRNYPDFRKRLVPHFKLLDLYGINYSKAIFEIRKTVQANPASTGVLFSLTQEYKTGTIRYTTDGTDPTSKYKKYKKPLSIQSDCIVKAAGFDKKGNKKGQVEQQFHINLASGKKINLTNEPSQSYNNGGAGTLVDGVLGRIPWNGKEWLGFSGKDLTAVIDLGRNSIVRKISLDVLRAEASWIYLPKNIDVYISADGSNYIKVGSSDSLAIVAAGRTILFNFNPAVARYVKITAANLGKIPVGKPGEGYDAWLFVDEISVE